MKGIIVATGTSGTIGKHFGPKVKSLSVDLRESLKVFSGLPIKENDTILHAGAIVGPSEVSQNAVMSRAINVEGTVKLASIARERNISRFVFVSTSHVYAPSDSLITESSAISPSSLYAHQKLEAENEILSIFKDAPEKVCVVRVFSVLDWDVPEFTLGGGIKKLALKVPGYKLTNSDDVRDFLTPKKIASVLVKITKNQSLFGVVNLCSGKGMSVATAARHMLEASGFEYPIESILNGNSTLPYMVGDNSKLTTNIQNLRLSWTPNQWKRPN